MNEPTRLLIVDDEPNVRLMFRSALESTPYGYEVTEADSGTAALEHLRKHPVDLILLDLNMPGLGGMDVLRTLRDAGHDVPVVIVTAHGDVPHAVQAMKLGAIDFLMKPLDPTTLRRTVSEVLARHAPEVPTEPEETVTAARAFATNLTRAKQSLNRRRFDEARVFLKQALALETNSAEAHNLMGVLHELANEHDDSYRQYKAALKADRHYSPAQQNMRRYYERYTFGRSDVPIDFGPP